MWFCFRNWEVGESWHLWASFPISACRTFMCFRWAVWSLGFRIVSFNARLDCVLICGIYSAFEFSVINSVIINVCLLWIWIWFRVFLQSFVIIIICMMYVLYIKLLKFKCICSLKILVSKEYPQIFISGFA